MKKILILGLGRATKNIVKFLLDKEIDLYAYEEKPPAMVDPEIRGLLLDKKIKPLAKINNLDLVITSPGFSEDKEIVRNIRKKKIPIIDEIEFTYRSINDKIIAVTGTNGKSTTTALIAHILNAAGEKCFLGGNLAPGKPFSCALLEPKYKYYVLEISSFQLERIDRFTPWIAVLTNITADHLDRHKTIDEYIDLKFRIFKNQQESNFAVLNYDDLITRSRSDAIRAQKVYFSKEDIVDGIYYQDGKIYNRGNFMIDVQDLPLPGMHNVENVMAATSVAHIIGIDDRSIVPALMTFTGLPHRLEIVAKINNITFINNSMCTNPTAAVASFKAVKGEKVVILGGYEKNLESKSYLDLVIAQASGVVIIGANKEDLADYFKKHGFKDYTVVNDMYEAVTRALQIVPPGGTVLLNPGFASFGDFKDFEERGEVFKDAVRKAIGKAR